MDNRNALDSQLLEMLCCPACRGDLAITSETELRCNSCRFDFPVVDGIPVLFPFNVRERFNEMFDRYWDSKQRAELYDHYVEGANTPMGTHYHWSEVSTALHVMGDVSNRRLLDCGCGNGRFFTQLPASTFTVGVDASLNLLLICKQKGRCPRLVCCEIEHLPFRERAFDVVLSVRVLQHLRKQFEAVSEMVRVCDSGGRVVLHLYNSLTTKNIAKTIRGSRLQPLFNAPFRMLFRTLSPFAKWPLDYDHYNSAFEARRWLKTLGVEVEEIRGEGFGFNKWLVEDFFIAPFLQKRGLLTRYLAASTRWENRFKGVRPAKYFMEKFVVRGRKP
jgi:ubiquinone/menaquinone biosynthesis C-methylase UbiE/uncharacterized protein YbaR (Trm112 family)